jgi:hypothetical protein
MLQSNNNTFILSATRLPVNLFFQNASKIESPRKYKENETNHNLLAPTMYKRGQSERDHSKMKVAKFDLTSVYRGRMEGEGWWMSRGDDGSGWGREEERGSGSVVEESWRVSWIVACKQKDSSQRSGC